jgi:hypothetical protein
MDATHIGSTWTQRRPATTVLCLTSAGLLAGGAGGYLIHRPAASAISAPSVVAPATPERALNGDSGSGYTVNVPSAAGSRALNGDSGSGYAAPAPSTAAGALNGDSTSGYAAPAPPHRALRH